jgi:hypothetical protein
MSDELSLVREAQYRAWRDDPALFFAEAWHIRHPEQGSIKFELRPAQVEALDAWLEHRYTICLKARQIGWSTLLAAYTFWLAFFHDDRPIVLLSRTEREAVDLLGKAKYGYDRLPAWVQERGPKLTAEHQQRMPFANGSIIESMPSRKDPARGKSVYLVGVDEWAFLENPEEAWASIEPITDVGGRVIGLSTANGSGNFFHQFWVRARTGNSPFKALFFPWSANTDRDDAWYEVKKAQLLPWQLAQEFPRTEDEAFIKSGNPVFDTDRLAEMATVEPLTGYLNKLGPAHYDFRISDGELSVWEPPQPNDRYVVGADVAEGLEFGDFSSAHVLKVRDGSLVATWHGRIDPDLFGSQVLADLGHWYNKALLGVEVNAHGLTTCTALKRVGYGNIYYRHTVDERTLNKGKKIGWHTSRVTKPLAIDELASSLRDGSMVVACAFTIAELRTYVREANGSMHGSPHDDRVMSLAIANQMRKHATTPSRQEKRDDYWTFDWWVRQALQADQQVDEPIGANNVRPFWPV